MWTTLIWIGIGLGALFVLFLLQVFYLTAVFAWEDKATCGLGYYGRPLAGRQAFKRTLRRHGRLLSPVLRVLGATSKFKFENGTFVYQGVAGPKGTCSAESFARGHRYPARSEDVFVITQMKCGTTWMQHLIYQVLLRGGGDLAETGTALYAVSPWLEARKSVPVEQAAPVGDERPGRVIKTHFPVELCPWHESARYVYVARHPVSCFASCADFLATNLGAFMPELEVVERWFCDDRTMWWGSWPRHVDGWWRRSLEQQNVLVVFFEDMKRDLRAVAQQVAAFLGVRPLAESELAEVVRKCSFAYMSQHDEVFEMHPPHILQTEAELFVSGKAERHKDVPAAVRERVAGWCAAALAASPFPLAERYPDVVAGGDQAGARSGSSST